MSEAKPVSAQRMAVQTAIILFVFVIIFTGLLSSAYQWTKPSIEASAAEEKMRLIDDVLPRDRYDNALLQDTLALPPTTELGTEEPTLVYRARRAGEPVALIFEAVAPDGYAGRIKLLIGLQADGKLAGVRVTQHKETPGLGDYVEPRKDKNKAHPWIEQFQALAFGELSERDWKVKKDGGRFDFYAGATITPRAVTKAVGKAVRWAEAHRNELYASGDKP